MSFLRRTASKPDLGSSFGLKKVLITDKVSPSLVEILRSGGLEVVEKKPKDVEDLKNIIRGFDVLIVRSETNVTEEVIAASAGTLKLVGRAGTGVDNIDVRAATKHGVLVMNTPGANTISAAEHTVALLLAAARNVQQAAISLKVEHKWARSALMGVELQGKTIGILGLGRIGREVAKRCQSFDMVTIGYDPVIPPEVSLEAGIKPLPLEEVLAQSDFLTVHTPLLDSTRGLLSAKTFPICKDGVIIVNCARGGIVDEDDLVAALDSGKVGGAGLDVFVEEPPKDIAGDRLINHPKVVATPHLGASTGEAQEKVAREIANQVIAVANGNSFAGTINAPALSCAFDSEAQPWLALGFRIGSIVGQLLGLTKKGVLHGDHLKSVAVETKGPKLGKVGSGLKSAVLAGFLNNFVEDRINMVNASSKAAELRIDVSSTHTTSSSTFNNSIEIVFKTESKETKYTGTVFGKSGRIVQIDDYFLEVEPEGSMLFIFNKDKPGVAARIGGVLADENVNISFITLGRAKAKGADPFALTIIGTDSEPSPNCHQKLIDFDDIRAVAVVHLPEF